MTVYVFPSARHAAMVDTIARGMAAAGSMDAAEDYLVDHLCIHSDLFERYGVSDDAVEHECREFARTAWLRYQELQREAGAA